MHSIYPYKRSGKVDRLLTFFNNKEKYISFREQEKRNNGMNPFLFSDVPLIIYLGVENLISVYKLNYRINLNKN